MTVKLRKQIRAVVDNTINRTIIEDDRVFLRSQYANRFYAGYFFMTFEKTSEGCELRQWFRNSGDAIDYREANKHDADIDIYTLI